MLLNSSGGFQTGSKELITAKGVDAVFETLDRLALETEADISKRVEASGADALMVVSQVESVSNRDPNAFYFGKEKASGGSFDIKIFIPKDEKPVWRGNLALNNSSGFGNIGSVAYKSATKVVEKLIEDKMI